jgi:putative DNA-binding protein
MGKITDRTMDESAGLRRLQEILYRLIVAPDGVADGLAHETALPAGGLAKLIAGDDRMTPVERLEIYANGYFYRLRDVLKEDFPATLAVAGADSFHNLVTGYLIDYPPTEPSIYHAGRNFAAYLGTHPLCARWPFLGDLARLERATLESFHAADAPALDAGALRTLAPAQWPGLALRTHPATRLVECAWCVDEVLRAVADGVAKTTIAPPAPAGAGGAIVVWRRDARVASRVAERGEDEALRLALAAPGATFAAMCEAVAAAIGEAEAVAAVINRLLARWLSDGVLIRAAN